MILHRFNNEVLLGPLNGSRFDEVQDDCIQELIYFT